MNLKSIFNKLKKLILYFLLFSFIILNILDFFNFFSIISSNTGDVDFFKKILSWALIYYLFANLSITKIITGFKSRVYDVLLLIGYSCVVFPSILNFYLNNVDFELYNIFSGLVNNTFHTFILNYTFLILNLGLVIISVVSILIFLNLPIHKESFIGSFSLNLESYFQMYLNYYL